MKYYTEPQKELPIRDFDVVVAGAGTGGPIAAIAAARAGARTALVEAKGYVGGCAVDGGTALHSFYNLGKAHNVPLRQVVKGLPQELVDRLSAAGGCTGHVLMAEGYAYDEICTAIDVEVYKLVVAEMLQEAGVSVFFNTLLVGADTENGRVKGVIVESRAGREYFAADAYIDCTGYGDLCARAGAEFTEPNDHSIAASVGVAGVSVEGYHAFLEEYDAVYESAYGTRDGRPDRLVRLAAKGENCLPAAFRQEMDAIGMNTVITTTHDDYFMFLKLNTKLAVSPTDRDAVSLAETEMRRRQHKAVQLLRQYVPGCERAFIARSAPSLLVRRGRCIKCDYTLTPQDIVGARHFEDDVMAYGFHDCAPRIQIENGGTYGVPYRALLAAGLENVFATGMMITAEWEAHMSTRNTVCCMGQGQAAGIAGALAAKRGVTPRQLPYPVLRQALVEADVHLEP